VPRPSSALWLATLAAVAFTTVTTSPASADDEITKLEKSLAEEHAALSTSDCSAACRALGSIRRAADKICALEPGPRCTAAHAKAEDATRRVREACPECAIASITPSPTPAPPAASPVLPPREEAMTKGGDHAPASESSRGGCASCDAGGASPGDFTAGALALLGLARLVRRRKKR
jgi:MYXO-CTERM domain-containing protein